MNAPIFLHLFEKNWLSKCLKPNFQDRSHPIFALDAEANVAYDLPRCSPPAKLFGELQCDQQLVAEKALVVCVPIFHPEHGNAWGTTSGVADRSLDKILRDSWATPCSEGVSGFARD